MIDICPTILAADARTYRVQIDQAVSFANRLHIDLADGELTPNKLLSIDQIWWPANVRADLHVMYTRPFEHLTALTILNPQLIIVHAEAEGDFSEFAKAVHQHGIETGVALLPDISVDMIAPALEFVDHVLIFSGNIGHFGGHADLKLLDKVRQLKKLKPELEIGWDGGVNDKNIHDIVAGGVEVVNAGGFLHGAKDPAAAYELLQSKVEVTSA